MDEDFPRSLVALEARVSTEAVCVEYLVTLRWSPGVVCPHCRGTQAWPTARGLWQYRQCRTQTLVTAGTRFHRTRLPLLLGFRAIWHITSQKYGANALGLQRILGLGNYETTWHCLHKRRRAMVRPGRDPLTGGVQVGETNVGGRKKPGQRGRGRAAQSSSASQGRTKGAEGIGRIRLQPLADASAKSWAGFAEAMIAPGSTVLTDDWSGY